MPIYEYECGSCYHVFEKKQRFDDKPITICPKCRAKSHRVIRSVPVIFKGSGFYVTDNRRPNSTEQPKESVVNKTED